MQCLQPRKDDVRGGGLRRALEEFSAGVLKEIGLYLPFTDMYRAFLALHLASLALHLPFIV